MHVLWCMYHDHSRCMYLDHITCMCHEHSTCMCYDHSTCTVIIIHARAVVIVSCVSVCLDIKVRAIRTSCSLAIRIMLACLQGWSWSGTSPRGGGRGQLRFQLWVPTCPYTPTNTWRDIEVDGSRPQFIRKRIVHQWKLVSYCSKLDIHCHD